MRLGSSLFLSFTLMAVALGIPGACGNSGLVGGDCRSGLSLCHGHCLDLKTDANNCGQCSNRCDSGVSCIHGFCGGGGEGWGGFSGDGNSGTGNHGHVGGGSNGGDGTAGNAGNFGEFDAGKGGSGAGGSGVGGSSGNGGNGGSGCTPPFDTAEHCGSCNTVCVDPTPVCTPVGNTHECQINCDLPLVNCNNACVDLNSDSEHCGACNVSCPSAICSGGQCIGAQAGHIVSVCMNYREVVSTSQAPITLLGNAVFLPLINPVKVLAFSQYADPTVQARVDQTIGWAAQARGGRTFQITTVTNPDDVNAQLQKPDYDVFLIYDQQLAAAGILGGYGTQWSKAIESFSFVGGIIVALDGNTGAREMGVLLTNAGILPVTAQSTVSRTQVYNRRAGDVIGVNVVSPFLAPRDACVFTTSAVDDSITSFVVTDNPTLATDRRPVAVHRIAIPKVK